MAKAYGGYTSRWLSIKSHFSWQLRKTGERGPKMFKKTRSDCTVGAFEKKHGLPAGTIRNRDGRDTRSDKLIGTIRKEAEKLRKK